VTPETVARIVERRDDAAFVHLLREADSEFADATFVLMLSDFLRAEPGLCDDWALWSGDQRWTPSAFVEGTTTGWFDTDRRHVRTHPDQASAVADFIHRMAAGLAREEIVEPSTSD